MSLWLNKPAPASFSYEKSPMKTGCPAGLFLCPTKGSLTVDISPF